MNLINYFILLIQTTFTIGSAPPIDVVFIIQNQDTKYHNELSRKLKENLIKQSVELHPNYTIRVHLLNELFNYPGGWTIHNLIPQLMLLQRKQQHFAMNTNEAVDGEIINNNTRWTIFCEEKTGIKLRLLMERLNYENYTQPLYLGYPLYDREPTIIHHFAFFENPKWFPYPMLRAGVVLSVPLFKSIDEFYAQKNSKYFTQQFSIDAGHELARFIYDNIHHLRATISTSSQKTHENKNDDPTSSHRTSNLFSDVSHSDLRTMTKTTRIKIIDKHNDEIFNPSDNTSTSTSSIMKTSFVRNKKIILKKAFYICPVPSWETRSSRSSSNKNNIDDESSCAMYVETTTNAASMTCTSANPNEIYFAVKTCLKYHNERLPIIENTWAPYAKHLKYFSDFQDDTIPTTNTGIPNVEMGHCAKTLRILKLTLKDIEQYNSEQQERHHANQIKWLFLSDDDTILSVSGVCQVLGCYNSMAEIYLGERYGYRLYDQDGFNYITGGGGIAFSLPVVKLILRHCSCPSPTAPDDMILGSCLHSLQMKALHSARFHQARPNDYPLELLQQETPVSFHKFWQLDPIEVYSHWFAPQDRQLLARESSMYQQPNDDSSNHFKSRKMFAAKTELLILNKIPVSVMTSLQHHSKERHVEL